MKRSSILLAAVPALVLAAGPDSETFVWKDCPPEIRVHAIREFMEIVQRDDLVVYSTTPGKLSGVCGRAKAPEIRAIRLGFGGLLFSDSHGQAVCLDPPAESRV